MLGWAQNNTFRHVNVDIPLEAREDPEKVRRVVGTDVCHVLFGQ